MSRRDTCIVLALTAVVANLAPARAELTAEEARALAESCAGVSLASAEVDTVSHGGARLIEFTSGEGAARCRHSVDATNGTYCGWVRISPQAWAVPDDAPEVTEDQALQAARSEAERILGAEAEALTWSATPLRDGGFAATGVSPAIGEPPRLGVGVAVDVDVRSDGELLSYSQILPSAKDGDPAPVRITEARAIEIAKEACGFEAPDVVEGPSLRQFRGRAEWAVAVASGAGPGEPDGGGEGANQRLYIIDAVTGEILETGRSGAEADAGPAVEAPRSSGGGLSCTPPLPLLALGAALLLAAGVGLVLLRRRR